MTASLSAVFAEAAEAVGAQVCRARTSEVPGVLARLLQDADCVVVDAELGETARELRDLGLPVLGGEEAAEFVAALPRANAGVCRALAAVAPSGTVAIGPGRGYEGYVSLLPAHCVVLVATAAIHPDLTAALSELAPRVAAAGSRLVFVTGPSRTSDIELTPVIGVHGPLRLDIVLVDE